MRRVFTVFSIVVHALVIAAVLVAHVLAVGTLPTPRCSLTFESVRLVRLADIPLPAPKRRAARDTLSSSAASENAAPTIAPEGVRPETGREGTASSPAPFEGVEREAGSGIEGLAGHGVPPPPPPVAPPPPIRLHFGVTPPRKIVDVSPAYPAVARSARVEGVVILEAVIDAQGRVESVRVLRSIPTLEQVAVDAVRQWRFTPALLNGEPVPVVMTVTVNFMLQGR